MPSHLSVEIFDTLQELIRVFRAQMRQRMEQIHPELTFGELRVLMHVGQHPGCTQKALVERSLADKAQMARTLTQLESRLWLTRSESTADRRVRHLRLTDEGQQLYERLAAGRSALASELLKDCPEPMQAQLLSLLHQARDAARPENQEAKAQLTDGNAPKQRQ